MVGWLGQHQIPAQVVATKIDKVSTNKRSGALELIRRTLEVDEVTPFSAYTGEGKRALWKIIQNNKR